MQVGFTGNQGRVEPFREYRECSLGMPPALQFFLFFKASRLLQFNIGHFQ